MYHGGIENTAPRVYLAQTRYRGYFCSLFHVPQDPMISEIGILARVRAYKKEPHLTDNVRM